MEKIIRKILNYDANWTKIELSKEEENKIKEVIALNNEDLKNITYEEMIKDKQRVLNERAEILAGTNSFINTFNFE